MTTNNQLKAFIERLEYIEAQKADLSEDFKEILQEAKSTGFDVKIIRKVLALRKKDAQKLKEEEALVATYMDALGMLSDTPLGQATLKRISAISDPVDMEDFD